MNTITILGNMARDIEKKTAKNGSTFYTLTVADNQGKEAVTFWDVIYFGELRIAEWLKKGSAVVITGEANPPKVYAKKDGTSGVDMSMTAYNVSFSPFKTSKPEDAKTSSQAPSAATASADSEAIPF